MIIHKYDDCHHHDLHDHDHDHHLKQWPVLHLSQDQLATVV